MDKKLDLPVAEKPKLAVRALAIPQAPCLGLSCPNGLHCSVTDNGIPTCVP